MTIKKTLGEVEKDVMGEKADPYTAAAALLDLYSETLRLPKTAREE